MDVVWGREPQFRAEFPFSGESGVKVQIEDKVDPLTIFEQFVTGDILDKISDETNTYAGQCIRSEEVDKPHARSKYWYDTDPCEIMLFIGFILLQGKVVLPNYSSYFSKQRIINCGIFSELFTERRFHLLIKYLHFANNENFESFNGPKRLFKIHPIINHFRRVFKNNYMVERNVSIDESLLLWKVYIPSKRSRFGIKSYELCESSSGYVWDLFIYIGKETPFDDALVGLAYGEKTILQLIHPLLNKGYMLTMDNFFSSLPLFQKLHDNKTEAIGTLRSNRLGIPKEIKEKKQKNGESFQLYSQKFMIVKFRENKKDIYILSTLINDKKVTMKSKGVVVEKPESIIIYNKTMGGVDLSDALLTAYTCTRKRVTKYYQKQFRHLIDIVCLNSFIVYQKLGGKINRLDFQMKLIENIILKYKKVEENEGRKTKQDSPLR